MDKEEKAGKSGPLACCSHKSCSSLSSSEAGVGVRCIGSTLNRDTHEINFNDQPNNNQFHLNQYQLKELKLPKRAPVNLEFKDIRYTVTEYSITKLTRTTKEILHGVDGYFKSGEITAIMGPSGAGKSSLLNILAGLTTNGMSGKVFVNGVERTSGEPLRFQRLSKYIQQDDNSRPYLTVLEAMTVAAHLKLGYSISESQKIKQVEETLSMLGLEKCGKVLTGKLSGGQRKRLAVALELLSNPPVLFLDEPTTGLDSSSCSQCVSLLKRLSQEGRTIICTIHQPSALIFEMFDKLYSLANGYCIYRGAVKQLLPFLSSQGFNCPPFHNPADFLIEIGIDETNVNFEELSQAATKAAEDSKSLILKQSYIQSDDHNLKSIMYGEELDDTKNSSTSSNLVDFDAIVDQSSPPANQFQQTWLLYKRNLITARRNYGLNLWRFLAHFCIGILFGYLYHNVGQNSETVLANYVYLYGTLLLVVYTGKMSVTLQFPLEMEILKREHFNRWYKLGPFIISTLAIEIPFQILCCATYISISYVMTGNLLVDFRLCYFFLIAISTSLCAQSWGYFIGATTPVKIAVFIGPVLAVLFSVFGFCIRLMDTPVIFRWLFHFSYFRAGFHSLVYSVYGMARDKLDCIGDGIKYCHYETPSKFLKEMDIVDIDIWGNLSLVIGLGIIMHITTAGALWFRLNRR
ncbi:ATP-binding cassette subfamily G member 4 [Arctopsyche grandis]|uniref:ATP-binding cassette subfamily G member 4 n=1 Tax=Arctopsyche grandis TaxID=121162 RepID=UPI00406D6CC4